ncbi:MAG: hypothetical protein K6G17_02535 [Oscillospiraceae bacterium]|nr:hypothetical protein [Oscillospiraceae bacterium]
MKFLRNTVVAILICALVVVGSTFFSVRRNLQPLADDVTDRFFAGNGIADSLKSLCDSAEGLAGIAESYGLDTSTLVSLSAHLRQDLKKRDLSEIYDLYQELSSELRRCEAQLSRETLSAEDGAESEHWLALAAQSQEKIGDSDYNARVARFFRDDLNVFSGFMARLCGVKLPSAFA